MNNQKLTVYYWFLFVSCLFIFSFSSDWLPLSPNNSWQFLKHDSGYFPPGCQITDTGLYCPVPNYLDTIQFKIDSIIIFQYLTWYNYGLFPYDPSFVRKDSIGNVFLFTEQGQELWFKNNPTLGDTWSTSYQNQTKTNTVTNFGEISVPAGSFSCYKVAGNIFDSLGYLSARFDVWWSDSIGPIRLEIVKSNGTSTYSLMGAIIDSHLIGSIKTEPARILGKTVSDLNIHPNPAYSFCFISYKLPSPEHVILDIFNVKGNKIASLENKYQAEGVFNVSLNARSIANGIYFCKLDAGKSKRIAQFIVIK